MANSSGLYNGGTTAGYRQLTPIYDTLIQLILLARPLAALNSSVILGQLVNHTFKIEVDSVQFKTREEEYSIWAAKLRLWQRAGACF